MRLQYTTLVLALATLLATSYARAADPVETNLRVANDPPLPVSGCNTQDCRNSEAQLQRLLQSGDNTDEDDNEKESNGEERISFTWMDDLVAKFKGKGPAVETAGVQRSDRLTAALKKANQQNNAKAAAAAANGGNQRTDRLTAALKKANGKDPAFLKQYSPKFQKFAEGYKTNADKLVNSLMTQTDDLMAVLSKNPAFAKAEKEVEKMLVNIAPSMANKQTQFQVKFKKPFEEVAAATRGTLKDFKAGTKEYQALLLKNQKDGLEKLGSSKTKDAAWFNKVKKFAEQL